MTATAEQITLGNEARTILETEAYKTAQKELVDNVIERWKTGVLDTVEAREAAFFEVRAAIAFNRNLQSYLDTLKVHAKPRGAKG